MSWIYPAQILKENVVRWIKISPLDAKDIAPPEVINDDPACANSDIFTFLTIVILADQNFIFYSRMREKN